MKKRRSLSRELMYSERAKEIIDSWSAPGLHTLSMGAGVQSTAILLKYGHKYDHVIFADTGEEYPETYQHIELNLKPYCKEHNINWITVKNESYDSLSDFCLKKEWTPNVGGLKLRRRCTQQFKINPMQKMLKELGATSKNPINVHIGISTDEADRLNKNSWIDKPKYEHKIYPLIDNKISRKDCYKIIADAGMPIPVKSGCDFCPFAGHKNVRKIAGRDPERYKRILQIDNCDKTGYHLFKHPLTLSHGLDEYYTDEENNEEQQACDSGHCFT